MWMPSIRRAIFLRKGFDEDAMLADAVVLELSGSFGWSGESSVLDLLRDYASFQELKYGEVLLDAGQYVKVVPLVLSGSLKVLRLSEEGHELFLYYLTVGQTCAMALSCCGTSHPSALKIVAEEDSRLVLVPTKLLEHLSGMSDWKNFIAQNYALRFNELLEVIDGVAFQKMDIRLEHYLKTKSEQLKSKEIHITHQDIALEMGTSREVISRLLKQMEKQGMIALFRNRLKMLE
jgi:CRP/FNR family transcriptional regulator